MTRLLILADIIIFSPKNNNFCYVRKYRQKLHVDTFFLILLTFITLVVLIDVIAIWIMSAELAIPGLLKIKVFSRNSCVVITFVYDITNKILSRDLKHNVVDIVM